MKKLEALAKAVTEAHARDDFNPGVAIMYLQDKLMWRVMIMTKTKGIVTDHIALDMALDEITAEFLNSLGRGPEVDALCKLKPNPTGFGDNNA